MTHTRSGKRWGEGITNLVLGGCMVPIRDASDILQSILVKANILAYLSFFKEKIDLWREYVHLI